MSSSNRSVLFILTNHSQLGSSGGKTGWYLPECAHPYHEFTSAGWRVDFASPLGGQCPMDPSSLTAFAKESISMNFYNDASIQGRINNSLKIDAVDFNTYDAVFVVGGHGPMWDEADCPPLQNKLASFYQQPSKVVGAVCHGPVALLNVYINGRPLLEGKTVTCFSNKEESEMKLATVVPFLLEDRVRARGANVQPAGSMQECVHCSDRVCTGQNPASAGPLAKQIISLCNSLAQGGTAQGTSTGVKQLTGKIGQEGTQPYSTCTSQVGPTGSEVGSLPQKAGVDPRSREGATTFVQPGMP